MRVSTGIEPGLSTMHDTLSGAIGRSYTPHGLQPQRSMNWYGHHIGDWLKKTSDITLVQEGVYRRLVDWCYANERPLPLPMREVANIARARGSRERTAVEVVVHRFFDLAPDGWHHNRITEELARYARGASNRESKKEHAKERQRRAREKRSLVYDALRNAGIVPQWNATMEELRELMAERNVAEPVTRDITERHAVTHGGETHNPTTNNQEHSRHALDAVTASRAGNACKAMRQAGFTATNPSDPRLLVLLDAGVTDDELSLAAAEAVARSKPWGWVLAVVAGRRKDAAQMGLERPQTRAEALVDAWAPGLASGPSRGRA